eukprot:2633531-Amphidinium_carterae.1
MVQSRVVPYSHYQGPEADEQVFQHQSTTGPLTFGSLYEVGAVISIGRQAPRHLKDFWAVVIDTGAAVSACPITFCEHIAVTPMAEDVQSLLLGLPDIDENKVTVHTGDKPYIDKLGKTEQLHSLGAHLHAAAMVLPGFHKPNEIKLDNTINTRYNPSLPTTLIVGDIEDISQQANNPKQLRQPPQPSKQEQDSHRLTHMPYRSWCPICVKSKGLPSHHRRGALKEQSVIAGLWAYGIVPLPTFRLVCQLTRSGRFTQS